MLARHPARPAGHTPQPTRLTAKRRTRQDESGRQIRRARVAVGLGIRTRGHEHTGGSRSAAERYIFLSSWPHAVHGKSDKDERAHAAADGGDKEGRIR